MVPMVPIPFVSQCQEQIASNENLAFSIYRVSNRRSLIVQEQLQQPDIQSDERKGGSRHSNRTEQDASDSAEESIIGGSQEAAAPLPTMTLLDRSPTASRAFDLTKLPGR